MFIIGKYVKIRFKNRVPTYYFLEVKKIKNITTIEQKRLFLFTFFVSFFMAMTSKIPIASGLLKEEQLTFQRKIQALIKWHDIPKDLVLNLDEMPLSYITAGNNTLEFQGAKCVPVTGKEKGKQIMGTFAVSATGRFLPMQLMCAGKTKRCHP